MNVYELICVWWCDAVVDEYVNVVCFCIELIMNIKCICECVWLWCMYILMWWMNYLFVLILII